MKNTQRPQRQKTYQPKERYGSSGSGIHGDRRTKRNRSRNNQRDNWKKEWL